MHINIQHQRTSIKNGDLFNLVAVDEVLALFHQVCLARQGLFADLQVVCAEGITCVCACDMYVYKMCVYVCVCVCTCTSRIRRSFAPRA